MVEACSLHVNMNALEVTKSSLLLVLVFEYPLISKYCISVVEEVCLISNTL